jgi:hypothetical protein
MTILQAHFRYLKSLETLQYVCWAIVKPFYFELIVFFFQVDHAKPKASYHVISYWLQPNNQIAGEV